MGAGSGSRPGHGCPGSARGTGSSPSGVKVMRSAGPRPPLSTGTSTASGPSNPCTRTNARRARSRSSSPTPPHSGSCSAPAEITSTGCNRSTMMGPVGRSPAFLRFNQPSNCQRTRSAVASSVNGSAHRHTLLSSSPPTVTAWMASLVHPTPADSRLRCNSAASDLPANAAASIRSTGGSQLRTASSSDGSSRPDGSRIGSARAMRWASIASAPNRDATSARDSAANAPKVRIPIRHNRSTTSSRPDADRLGSAASCRIDSADRNTASPPGSMIRPARAAKTAVGSSSAIPI